MPSIKSVALLVLALQASLQMLSMRYSRLPSQPQYIPSTAVLTAELLKMVASAAILLIDEFRGGQRAAALLWRDVILDWRGVRAKHGQWTLAPLVATAADTRTRALVRCRNAAHQCASVALLGAEQPAVHCDVQPGGCSVPGGQPNKGCWHWAFTASECESGARPRVIDNVRDPTPPLSPGHVPAEALHNSHLHCAYPAPLHPTTSVARVGAPFYRRGRRGPLKDRASRPGAGCHRRRRPGRGGTEDEIRYAAFAGIGHGCCVVRRRTERPSGSMGGVHREEIATCLCRCAQRPARGRLPRGWNLLRDPHRWQAGRRARLL
eukprot:scaffold68468_cov36-Tisochrysis_lutea.AAC.3